jgi:hypothetical protein
MEVVSNQSDEDMAKMRASRAVERASRELAVNVLRVVRGAGKPEDMLSLISSYAKASQEFWDTHRYWPFEETREAISYHGEDGTDWSKHEDHEYNRKCAIDDIIGGALQMAASRLAGQGTQERAGERQLIEGVKALERAHEEGRVAYAKAYRTITPQRRR